MATWKEAELALEQTSRTFVLPILALPGGVREAVGSAYLCMRAIDEIEDDPWLEPRVAEQLLFAAAEAITCQDPGLWLERLSASGAELPDVTRRLFEWAELCPSSIAPRVFEAVALMSERMARWVRMHWAIETERDLDHYTHTVAGSVGILLCDLWAWHDGTRSDRRLAVEFGQGLQAVNILRNRTEDLARGVSFFPRGWNEAALHAYAHRKLRSADEYVARIDPGPGRDFCAIPLALAKGTLAAMRSGEKKLGRQAVRDLIESSLGARKSPILTE